MAPLRAFFLSLVLLLYVLVAVPLGKPLSRRWPALAERVPILLCRTLLRVLRVSVEAEGLIAEDGPVLFACNHVSWIDILVLGSLHPFCFLAKREVASWPVLSRIAAAQGTLFVDRRRRRAIPSVNRAMAARMLGGRKVFLFPEGTTFDGGVPGPFFSSHFAAARELLLQAPAVRDVAIQPVALGYSSVAAAWIGDDALIPHLWRVLRGEPIRCLVAFEPPIAYGRGADRKAVARLARDAVVQALARLRATRPDLAWTREPGVDPTLAFAVHAGEPSC